MDVVLLGSGAADGWPNPFCWCASCAAQRRGGTRRVSTSALVDDVLLLDLGPDTARQADRFGHRLDRVRHVLVTHAHPDHFDPASLLWWQWAGRTEPLDVVGPATVVEQLRDWVGDDATLRLHVATAGITLTLGAYAVLPMPAAHEVDCLLYQVTGPDEAALLYATDTGPLPEHTMQLLADTTLDLLLLEETFGSRTGHGTGHHDLVGFAATLAGLRAAGTITTATEVVAVHLGHHNPPEPELAGILADWGARAGQDGMRLTVPGPGSDAAPSPAPGSPSIERRTLLLGGARSGKSHAAETMLAGEPAVVYLATAAPSHDPDWASRVAAHRQRRPPRWTTVETVDVADLLNQPGPPVLVDCLTLWLTGVLDRVGAWDEARWASQAETAARAQVDALVAAVRRTSRTVVMVSNEVGSGVVPDTWSGRLFRDELGRLNRLVAAECDRVDLVVAGHRLPLRPGP